ncbi:MAG: zinc ABC transporter substrate-binding protein [Magnetococcales bacterium]|nr:zinc ABC transporter substrate-binding protein [Magnetococcales bacterium]
MVHDWKKFAASCLFGMILVWLLNSWAWAGQAPRVLVSIKPIHALVAAVMKGVGDPKVMLQGSASPHTYALRPSEASSLRHADVVFWVGEDLESFLVKPMLQLAGKASLIALSQAPGVQLLPNRQLGSVTEPSEHHEDAAADAHHHGTQDMHVWLSPANAVAMVEEIRRVLSELDPKHMDKYLENAQKITKKIQSFDDSAKKRLATVGNRPFVVFHDAYHYFEKHFSLNNAGSISFSPERPVSVKRLHEIQETIKTTHAVCLFAEPQFQSALVETIVRDTGIKKGVLDPLGVDTPKGEEGWFVLMNRLVDALVGCLL